MSTVDIKMKLNGNDNDDDDNSDNDDSNNNSNNNDDAKRENNVSNYLRQTRCQLQQKIDFFAK